MTHAEKVAKALADRGLTTVDANTRIALAGWTGLKAKQVKQALEDLGFNVPRLVNEKAGQ
jgi:hypothetical protein